MEADNKNLNKEIIKITYFTYLIFLIKPTSNSLFKPIFIFKSNVCEITALKCSFLKKISIKVRHNH